MKVLFISDNFPPEINAPASRTYEHAKRWVADGADVTVITCAPNFPKGELHDGYENRSRWVEYVDGIRVVRVKSYITGNEGFTRRILDYMSFMVTAVFFGSASLFAMLIFAVTVFDLPARAGTWSILGLQLLTILVSTALGLVASTLAKSQLQAFFVAAVYGFSLMFLTGLLYPIEQAHPIVHLISRIVPLTFSHEPMTDW